MAITTLNQILDGTKGTTNVFKQGFNNKAAGITATSFYVAGSPAAAAAPTGVGLAGAALTSYAGQIPVPSAVAGDNIYLGGMQYSSGPGGVAIIDRLWHNYISSTLTTTTAQTVGSPALPARDQAGGSTGNGVLVAIEVATVTGNTGAITNTTLSYTNDQGVSGRTATLSSFPVTATAGTFIPFNLQAGDYGVRSIETVTLGTSYVSGAVCLVMYREMASVGLAAQGSIYAGPVELGMPRIYDNSVLQLVHSTTSTSLGQTNLVITYLQG